MTEILSQPVDPLAVFNETRDQAIINQNAAMAAMLDARNNFDSYSVAIDKAVPGCLGDRAAEARKRLTQMILTLEEVNEFAAVEAAAGAAVAAVAGTSDWADYLNSEENRRLFDLIDHDRYELRTETFYWLGGRARSVIRSMPALKSFEGKGVRDVRNKLIEHADGKDSGVMICSFASGGGNGPIVKGVRYEDQVTLWPDAGLYVNAIAFSAELINKIGSAIASIESGSLNL